MAPLSAAIIRRMGAWEPLRLTVWPGVYVIVIIALVAVIYGTRGQRLIRRLFYGLGVTCIALAVSQVAGFHLGRQSDEWAAVTAALVVVVGTFGALLRPPRPSRHR